MSYYPRALLLPLNRAQPVYHYFKDFLIDLSQGLGSYQNLKKERTRNRCSLVWGISWLMNWYECYQLKILSFLLYPRIPGPYYCHLRSRAQPVYRCFRDFLMDTIWNRIGELDKEHETIILCKDTDMKAYYIISKKKQKKKKKRKKKRKKRKRDKNNTNLWCL